MPSDINATAPIRHLGRHCNRPWYSSRHLATRCRLSLIAFVISYSSLSFANDIDPVTDEANVKAFLSISPAAKSGNPAAQRLLASMYENGEGVEKDIVQAIYWYRKAADLDDDIAQFYLGYIYYQGTAVVRDYPLAFKWFAKAAAHGNPDFQYNLGNLYRYGEGTDKNFEKALHWYTLAAQQGQPNAQQDLATIYQTGEELTQDLEKAYLWQALAHIEDKQSPELVKIAAQLNPEQLNRAKQQVTSWLEENPDFN